MNSPLLHYSVVHFISVQYSAVQYLQCSAVQLITIQCSAVDPRAGVTEVTAVGWPGGPVDTEVTGVRVKSE